MNHDLVEMFREKLDSFTISDYHGLNSPGLTCYLNSVLQVLFMTEDFREAVKRCCCKDSTTIDSHLGKLFADLQKSMAKTHHVTKKLGITNVYEQRDAAEYFEKILCLTSPEASKIFKGELNHKTTCLKCKATNDSRSSFWILPLAVKDLCRQTYSVEKGLKAFFKAEKVCGYNKMYCNRCNKKRDADFGCEITQNPEILTLLLKRFSFDYKRRCYVKIYCNVDVPQTLHMENCKYDLYALVNHFGNLTGGHYTAQIKSFETQLWYHFNDDIVEGVKQPLFGAGDKSLRSCTAYLLMYRKVSRHPEKTDDVDQEACSAHSDVEAEGRHGEAERGEALDPLHQLKDESCNGGENLMHLNGDILKKGYDDMVLKKTDFTGELENQLENQRMASVRPHKEMLLQTDTGADGDSYKPCLKTQKSNFAKLQKDGGQKSHELNRHQLNINSKEQLCHLNTRGTPTVHLRTHNADHKLEQSHESQKKRLKVNDPAGETQINTVAKTGTKTIGVTDISLTINSVKPAAVKNKREAAAEERKRIEGKSIKQRGEDGVSANMYDSDVKSFNHFSNGYSSSSVPYLTGHLQSPFNMYYTGCNYSSNICRKSNSSKREKEKMQHVVAAHGICKLETTRTVTKGEQTASSGEKREAAKRRDKINKELWR
ncbi:ubiquitin carboxyl-terminal hydrolase 47 isoform X2 [Siniperca chuatsi]|nr:ubiquitin carboxyl-terminal hydrolase 47 isoform X2 [Siniperca chuatsi]